MRAIVNVRVSLMVVGILAAACVPTPEPRQETDACCAETGGIALEYANLPFPPGPLPPLFTFEGVEFGRVWDEITFDGDALWCLGSEEFPPGTWNDATVKLDLAMLPCAVCGIVADCAGNGPEARLEARMAGGGTQTAICPGEKGTVTLTTSVDVRFMSAVLSGQEAEWFVMRLE